MEQVRYLRTTNDTYKVYATTSDPYITISKHGIISFNVPEKKDKRYKLKHRY